ncbi:HAD-IIIC family phosphatase [Stieleria sp. TO1_6]|uniref:HAD-IIIC family phosphatase n=1 Tax=Stieleria tagensis TaxID=2956795 RepID=UPI00209AFF9E|nr:HAD-IIIC family phosphatase [Stieleria tagensis]MCO8125490.1 HAD-IIIC family phosphatase [Stieleria tagensis]
MKEQPAIVNTLDPSRVVKLLIWDLDETFWDGTLTEEGISYRKENIQLVKQLADRGIVSSICSKNDFTVAKAALECAGVWELIVFPTIHWGPKGTAIKNLIARANLRSENVLFVDDNLANLEEAMFFSPGLMCMSESRELRYYLNEPCFRGRPDPSRSRLASYKVIEERTDAKQSLAVSNLDFLRQSRIQVEISYDVEDHWDRVIELLNRANQLNYTKKRVETDVALRKLSQQLTAFGFKAGVVRVRDRYGDYGIAGFFLTLATLLGYELKQFVFSCRVLNMGVEQYVYELLNEPDLQVVPPVANPVKTFERVDWINQSTNQEPLNQLRSLRLVLVGGCDMLQVSSYCSSESIEFTNRPFGEMMTRFDEVSFLTGDVEQLAGSKLREKIPVCNADDIRNFHQALQTTDGVVLALYQLTTPSYFRGKDGVEVRLHPASLRKLLASENGIWFVRHFWFLDLKLDQRLQRVRNCINSVLDKTDNSTPITLVGERVSPQFDSERDAERKQRYNQFIQSLAHGTDRLTWIDPNEFVPDQWVIDGAHYHRQAYLEIAERLLHAETESLPKGFRS